MKIIIFDDDPTGSQTVNNCPLLLKWDQETLSTGIENSSTLIFILGNTRSMSPKLAKKTTSQICLSVSQAIKQKGLLLEDFLFVSRGDSTLRGHGVLEPEVINNVLGPFDATFHIPAFFEGGRNTIDGIHLLNGTPVHKTPFARDKIFGYSTSDLALWLQEKSHGAILANSVERVTLDLLDNALESPIGMKKLLYFLFSLSNNKSVIVDAKYPHHLAILGKAVRNLIGQKRFLYRSAASFINGLADLPTNLCSLNSISGLKIKSKTGKYKPGLVVIGSYVPLANQQLESLLKAPSCIGIELDVHKISAALECKFPELALDDLEKIWLNELNYVLSINKTPILFTSRKELSCMSSALSRKFGNLLAELMAKLVSHVYSKLGYIISKGGITTHNLLEKGLKLNGVHLIGQLMPGISIVYPFLNSKLIRVPIVTFPGNLGNKDTLLLAWKMMESI